MPEIKSSERLEVVKSNRTKDCVKLLKEKGLNWDNFEIFIRAFKKEGQLEVWAKTKEQARYSPLKRFPFCKNSGILGPKRKEGDLQIPEGIYHINRFNPESKFHLSLGINYPNASDLKFADRSAPGSDIFIHGDCVTVGCIPITDQGIELVYLLAEKAFALGQKKIPVHIFPAKLDVGLFKTLRSKYPQNMNFWSELQPIYRHFDRRKQIPVVTIDGQGHYQLQKAR